jgi:cephalosporin hydroxylase
MAASPAFPTDVNPTAFVSLLSRTLHDAQQTFSERHSVQPRYHLGSTTLQLEKNKSVTADDVALGLELFMSPVSQQNAAPGGEGSNWFGVPTLQNPLDAAMLQQTLWHVQPDLVLEIGTHLGGSALFLTTIMGLYNPAARLLTYDITQLDAPHRHDRRWREAVAAGRLIPRVADVTAPVELELISRYAANASTVLIIDDGDHFTTPLLLHFELLSRHVTPGSYYLVQDTRLDRTCEMQIGLNERNWSRNWQYCMQITGGEGGPARASRFLLKHSRAFYAGGFRVDRSREAWGYSAHPAGWLHRDLRCVRMRAAQGVSIVPNATAGARLGPRLQRLPPAQQALARLLKGYLSPQVLQMARERRVTRAMEQSGVGGVTGMVGSFDTSIEPTLSVQAGLVDSEEREQRCDDSSVANTAVSARR